MIGRMTKGWIAGCLLLAGTAMAGEEPMDRIFPYISHAETLDNGLKVIVVPMKSEGLVAYWSVVRTGSRDEYEPGHTGFAHFFEHMMFRGTESYPAEVYNQIITELGADANAFTTDDLTAYHMGIAAEDLETVVKIESDRFRNLAYEKEAFQTEAGAVYGEYRKNRMNPFFALNEGLQAEAFRRHTYGHTTMGYVDDIKAMPEMYEYSLSFFSRYYRPENVVLLIVGDVDPAETHALVRQYYGDWEPGYVPPTVEAEPVQDAPRSIAVDYPGRTRPILVVAYKVDRFDARNKTYLAADLLTELAFGETSEIHRKLVLDEQAVEFIFASIGRNRDPGLLEIYTRIKDPSKIDYVKQEIERTIDAAKEDPPGMEELDAVKSRQKYGFLMGLDTPDRVAQRLARVAAITGGIEAVDQTYATMETITPADVQAAAQAYLVPQRRTVALLKGAK